jgi:hypothetical protein
VETRTTKTVDCPRSSSLSGWTAAERHPSRAVLGREAPERQTPSTGTVAVIKLLFCDAPHKPPLPGYVL